MIRRGFLVACLTLWFAGAVQGENGLPPILEDVGLDQRLDEPVPLDLPFRDEAGTAVTLGDCCGGKPVILVLAYYRCPMLCNQVLNGLVDSLRGLRFDVGDEFNVVIVSIDAREMPELAAAKKANYVRQYGRPGAGNGWHFLTGEQPSIDRLTQATGFRYKYLPEKDQFAHASGILLLTPQGRIARYFYGIRYPPGEVRLGLVEASANKIGSQVDQVLLFCYHYDPASGKYTATVMNLMRLAGALTLLGMGTFLFLAWRRDWGKHQPLSPLRKAASGTPAE